MTKSRVAVLISGRGSNMLALLEAARQPSYPAEIAVVVSSRPQAPGLELARSTGVKTCALDHAAHSGDREGFERTMQEAINQHRVDLICLAGFMRLLTPWFVRQWEGRMLNIHPSLLPAFKGLNTHARALAAGVKIHGATVHLVTAEMDCGPILVQGAVAVRDDDDAERLAARVLEVEHRIYPLALRLLASGSVRLDGQRCLTKGVTAPSHAFIVPKTGTTRHDLSSDP
jgi:phosphoribosylglycinamide formyltransferase 1